MNIIELEQMIRSEDGVQGIDVHNVIEKILEGMENIEKGKIK